MPTVVGVAFRPVTKVYYFDPQGLSDLVADEYVVVELGQVVFSPREVDDSEVAGALKPVVRRASAWDMVQADQMAHREPEALQVAVGRAQALGMNIKISNVEFSFDGSSAVVYFTSDQRVDFRNLVHDLSQQLRTRVEMRQVGVRDEAKFIGGFGKCGRELCCSTWLREFTPVSIKMAKTQDLPLNAPEVVETPDGVGKVKQVHVLANTITVLVEGPNETRSWVQMPAPEPQFSVPVGRPALQDDDGAEGMEVAAEAADALDAQDGMDAPGEDTIPRRERGQQQMPDEESDTGPRGGSRRRRKR